MNDKNIPQIYKACCLKVATGGKERNETGGGRGKEKP
jgi:hypothetical protein